MSLVSWLKLRAPGWGDLFHAIAVYALADGALAFVTAALSATARYRGGPRALVVMTIADAVARVGLGLAILILPAIAEVPMTLLSLFGVVGTTAALLGVVGIVSWAVAHHRRQREHSVAYEALFDPIPAIAFVSIVVGARLTIDPPSAAEQLRSIVSAGGIAVALGFVVAGVGGLAEAIRGQ